MLQYTFENEWPANNLFKQTLNQILNQTNPVDDLLTLAGQLWEFEQTYHLSSSEFYNRYQAGLLDDTLQHCVEWAATYSFFLKTKRQVEVALMRSAVQSPIPESLV